MSFGNGRGIEDGMGIGGATGRACNPLGAQLEWGLRLHEPAEERFSFPLRGRQRAARTGQDAFHCLPPNLVVPLAARALILPPPVHLPPLQLLAVRTVSIRPRHRPPGQRRVGRRHVVW